MAMLAQLLHRGRWLRALEKLVSLRAVGKKELQDRRFGASAWLAGNSYTR